MDGYESTCALVLTSWETEKFLVMNFGSSYKMCHGNEYFEILDAKKGGVVFHQNYKAYKVQGINSIYKT